jgi:hypothetical protein
MSNLGARLDAWIIFRGNIQPPLLIGERRKSNAANAFRILFVFESLLSPQAWIYWFWSFGHFSASFEKSRFHSHSALSSGVD